MQYIPINTIPNIRRACLCELNGLAEQDVSNTKTVTAIHLLNQLLIQENEFDLHPGRVGDLSVVDRDALLVALYEQTYGLTIETYLKCQNCNNEFEINFNISDIQSRIKPIDELENIEQDSNGNYKLNGYIFRLPTGNDELSIMGLSSDEAMQELFSRCMVKGDSTGVKEKLQDIIQQLAPMCDIDLSAECPDCLHNNSVHFNLQSYVLTALVQERAQLLREIHCLARSYGWSLDEIINLPRKRRRAFVQLVEMENIEPGERLL